MTIQSDILFIPEDFSTSQLNKRTEYLVEYLKECSLIAGNSVSNSTGISECADLAQEIRPAAAVAVAGRLAAVL